jgi:AcrR family transcriptional regulator
MSKSAVVEVVDGRRQRCKRAIIEAVLSLIDNGVLAPTVLQISQRAGVGIRSFFRHFEDMEILCAGVDNYPHDSYAAYSLAKIAKVALKKDLSMLFNAMQRHIKS